MTDQSFLASGGFTGGAGYGLQNLLGLGALALWLISSTIAAPIIIQKAISHGTQVGQALFATTATAGIAGLTAGIGAATTFGAAGGWPVSLAVRPRQEPPHSSEQLKPLPAAALIRRLEILSVR